MSEKDKVYQEVLADVKRLRELAEAKAHQVVTEKLTSDLKLRLEAALSLSEDDSESVDKKAVPAALEKERERKNPRSPQDVVKAQNAGDSASKDKKNILVDKTSIEGDPIEESEDEVYELTQEGVDAIAGIASLNSLAVYPELDKRINLLESIADHVINSKDNERLSHLVEAVNNTYSCVLHAIVDPTGQRRMCERLSRLAGSVEEKFMKRKGLRESKLGFTIDLPGLKDEDLESALNGANLTVVGKQDDESVEGNMESVDAGADELDVDVSGEEDATLEAKDSEEDNVEEPTEEEGDDVIEIDEKELKQEIARLTKGMRLAEGDDKHLDAKQSKAMKNATWEDGEDLGDPWLDAKIEEAAEGDLEEGDDVVDEGDALLPEGDELDEADGEDLDESDAADAELEECDMAPAGEKQLEMHVESAKKFYNAHKSAKTPVARAKYFAAYLRERREARKVSKQINESKKSASKTQSKNSSNSKLVKEHAELLKQNAQLKTALTESRLMNEKLVLVNKVIQNSSLSHGQKVEFVQKLDEATNRKEVAAISEKLTKRQQSKPRSQSRVNESVGGASRTVAKPAQAKQETLAEGSMLERWAKIAGLVNG